MNTNKIIILCVILGVLGGGLWYRKQNRTMEAPGTVLQSFAEGVDTDAISRIELHKGNATIELDRKEGWAVSTLSNAPASSTTIEAFLREVKTLSGELRSNDPTILADYGLDDASALHLVLRQGESEKLHLLLGKGDFRNVFVRAKNSSIVFAAPGTILNAAGTQRPAMDGQFWIETNLLSLNLPDVHALTVSTPEYEIRYTRKDGTNATAAQEWDMDATRGKGPGEKEVKNALMAMTRISVAEVLAPTDPRATALAKPTHILTVTTGNATQTVEAVRPDPKTDAIARIKGSPFTYTMRASIFERIFPVPAKESK